MLVKYAYLIFTLFRVIDCPLTVLPININLFYCNTYVFFTSYFMNLTELFLFIFTQRTTNSLSYFRVVF